MILLPLLKKKSSWNERGQWVDETGKAVNQYFMEGKYYVGDDYFEGFKTKDEMLSTYKDIARARGYKKQISPKSVKMFVEYEDGSTRSLSKRGN